MCDCPCIGACDECAIDSEIVFSLDHLSGDAWVDELWYRMFSSSIGSDEDMTEIGDIIDHSDDYLISAGDELERILQRHAMFIEDGNVYRYTNR